MNQINTNDKNSQSNVNYANDPLDSKVWIIVKYILVFVIINGIIWGGQELYHRKDTQAIKRLDEYLLIEKETIEGLENKINAESTNLDGLQEELNYLEANGFIDMYNNKVDQYNDLLYAYKNDLDIHDDKISEYNLKVEEVNKLIEKSSTRWYIIPIPLPNSKARLSI
ncbi:MAG: hypothetical protein ABIJ81_03300 [Patescibacteria group bacterium]